MAYQSPLKVLQNFGLSEEELTNFNFSRLQKKILSEFNLTSNTTININGKEFTKDAAIKFLDELKLITDFEVHQTLFTKPALLNFCENPTTAQNPLLEIGNLIQNPESKPELLEIIENAEAEVLKFNLKNSQYLAAYQLVETYLSSAKIIPYQFITLIQAHTENINAIFRAVQPDNLKVYLNSGKIDWMWASNWPNFFNLLGDEFQSLRDAIGRACTDFIAKNHKANKKKVLEVSNKLIDLDVESNLAEIIYDNHKIVSESKNSGSYDIGIGRIIFYLLWVVFIIYRCSDKPSREPSTIIRRQTDPYMEEFIRKLQDSAVKQNLKLDTIYYKPPPLRLK